MKVYIVTSTTDFSECRITDIEKVFLSKEKAVEFSAKLREEYTGLDYMFVDVDEFEVEES